MKINKFVKNFVYVLLILVLINFSARALEVDRETIFQVSTINALFAGVYDGQMTIEEAKKYGDTGLGTFTALDGEMIQLDGKFYQIKADGIAYEVSTQQETPFLVTTFFDNDQEFELAEELDFTGLTGFLDQQFPGDNIFYMIKIKGDFSYMKTRSVPAQEKPYPLLSEALENQPVFEFENIRGTMVGIRCPEFVEGVNLPGYHFHFISEDRKSGGHILDLEVNEVTVQVDYTHNFLMELAESEDYLQKDLSEDRQEELEEVEN